MPSRHRRDSYASYEVVGSFVFDSEAVRTESSDPRRFAAPEEESEEEEAVPFVRGGRAQAKKEAAHKASFKASSKPNDGIVDVASLKPLPAPVAKVVQEPVETVVVAEPVTVEQPKSPSGSEAVSPTRTHTTRVSTPKRKKDAAAKALRVQARLAAAAARLKARTAFLGGRANKVDEVKGKIEVRATASCDDHTPSTRLVSIREDAGWSYFRFRAGSDRVGRVAHHAFDAVPSRETRSPRRRRRRRTSVRATDRRP